MNINSKFLTLLACFLSVFALSSCFENPSELGKPIPVEKAQPFAVSPDSISFELLENDYDPGYPRRQFVCEQFSNFARDPENSTITIDTSGAHPRVSFSLHGAPNFRDKKEADESIFQGLHLTLDSLIVGAGEWRYLNSNQIGFTVRVTKDLKNPRYIKLPVAPDHPSPPYYQTETFSRLMSWSSRDRKEITVWLEAQLNFLLKDDQNRPYPVRQRISGAIRIRY